MAIHYLNPNKPRIVKYGNGKGHARCCIECEKSFKRDDLVIDDVALTFHRDCLGSYINTERELGLL